MSNSIGSYARELIAAHPDKSNQEIRDMVLQKFTEAKTSISCIAWYKSNMKKTGFKQSAPPPRTLEVIEEEIIELKQKLVCLEEEAEELREAQKANDEEMLAELAKRLGKQIVDANTETETE